MKDRIYRIFVNRVPGIRERYLQKRIQKGRLAALFALFWLNIQYYLLFRKSLRQPDEFPFYEKKQLYSKASESSLSCGENPEAFADRLMEYDIVSFDVFDTLLLRPFSNPADLFFFVGMELNYPDFKRLRIQAEEKARQIKEQRQGTREVTLEEIWTVLETETGISKERGMKIEWEWEKKCCYANPYLLRTVKSFRKTAGGSLPCPTCTLRRSISERFCKGMGMELSAAISCPANRENPNTAAVCTSWFCGKWEKIVPMPISEIMSTRIRSRPGDTGSIHSLTAMSIKWEAGSGRRICPL